MDVNRRIRSSSLLAQVCRNAVLCSARRGSMFNISESRHVPSHLNNHMHDTTMLKADR